MYFDITVYFKEKLNFSSFFVNWVNPLAQAAAVKHAYKALIAKVIGNSKIHLTS